MICRGAPGDRGSDHTHEPDPDNAGVGMQNLMYA